MKILFYFFSLILSSASLCGQNKIIFNYDAAGNFANKEVILALKSTMALKDTVSIEQMAERDIRVYPNPTFGMLKVEIGNTEGIKNCTITVSSMETGKQVLQKKATLPVTDIDISNQRYGIYVLLIDIDGQYTSWKIIKNP